MARHSRAADEFLEDLWAPLVAVEDDNELETTYLTEEEYLGNFPDAKDYETEEWSEEEKALELGCEIVRQLAGIRDILETIAKKGKTDLVDSPESARPARGNPRHHAKNRP